MSNINQRIKGGNVEVRCEKCGMTKEISMSKKREDIDRDIKAFEKDHKHPAREK